MAKAQPRSKNWCVYLLECKNGAFYTGITNELEKRFKAHQRGTGAKYTRANPPLRILASAPACDRSQASKMEVAVKRLPKKQKLAWFKRQTSQVQIPQSVG